MKKCKPKFMLNLVDEIDNPQIISVHK
jgi:hypothetical protein